MIPVTVNILSAVHVNIDGNITDMLSPANAAHAQTNSLTSYMAAKYSPIKDSVREIKYTRIIVGVFKNRVIRIPRNLPAAKVPQNKDVTCRPSLVDQPRWSVKKVVNRPENRPSVQAYTLISNSRNATNSTVLDKVRVANSVDFSSLNPAVDVIEVLTYVLCDLEHKYRTKKGSDADKEMIPAMRYA